ncbi:MAG: hypothetical protein JRE16_05325 [Deltaproteobacteria bacterium]|jgi:hypothetical protein|nr:hypothetical protein [Deltaproteobacteria bacterium]MBW2503974.1 hypothetical protein [Deltaproteobacteria bacterium]
MKKITIIVAVGLMMAIGAYAEPIPLSHVQMDSITAGGVERVDGFVCPVITTDAVLNSPKGGMLGIEGFYTIGGPDVMVPVHATNGAGNGNNPGGPFSQPGDLNYTAIWAR